MYLAYRYIDGDVLETRAQGSSGTPSCLRFASLLLLAIVPLFFLGGLRRSLLPSGQALAEPFGSSRAEAINMPFHLLCLGGLRRSLPPRISARATLRQLARRG